MLMQHYVFYAHHVSPRDKIQKKKKKNYIEIAIS